jgi:hypothetical protein
MQSPDHYVLIADASNDWNSDPRLILTSDGEWEVFADKDYIQWVLVMYQDNVQAYNLSRLRNRDMLLSDGRTVDASTIAEWRQEAEYNWWKDANAEIERRKGIRHG